MALVPVALNAIYDTTANALTLRIELPIPPPPPGYTENDGWWTMNAPTAEVTIGLKKNAVTTNPVATYFTPDPANPTGHETWQATYLNGAWQLPGTRIS